MEFRELGRTGLKVSVIGLGTMTFGVQNTEAEGHAQIDRALDAGVNFVDTAEVYAVPPTAESYGTTERIIGSWIAQRRGRDRIILATKVAGPGGALGLTYVRGGDNRLDRQNILEAIDGSRVTVRAVVPPEVRHAVGDRVLVHVPPSACHLLLAT